MAITTMQITNKTIFTILAGIVFCEANTKESVIASHLTVPPARKALIRSALWKNGRITFGEEAEPHSAPYMVALYMHFPAKTTFCGGSLISRNYVLTAGHCVNKASWIEILLGAHDLSSNEKTQIRMNATNYVLYEGFAQTVVNDIALIKLPRPIKLNRYIQVLNLPSYADRTETFEGHLGTVLGWGKTEIGTGISDVLKYTELGVISNELCEYYFGTKVKDTHLCTSGTNNKGPCNGDSGGPLIVDAKQVGIVSYGLELGCTIFEFPNGYTRVTDYLRWIEDNSDVNISNN